MSTVVLIGFIVLSTNGGMVAFDRASELLGRRRSLSDKASNFYALFSTVPYI